MKASNNIQVGQLAMIINTFKEVNRPLIGRVVTVDHITHYGEDVSQFFEESQKRIIEDGDRMVFCSGVTPFERTGCKDGPLMKVGVTRFRMEHLMPLPPLEEEEIQKERELELL